MTDVHGRCDGKFSNLKKVLSDNLDDGSDIGASVSVYVDGEAVVDLWGGYADAEKLNPWTEDTITNVFSTTKTMVSLSALILADRSEIDLHTPVSHYWPEFKANGKENIEIRHLMGHTSGLSGWSQPLVTEDLYDWEKCTSLLAGQAPWWSPGTASGYHANTQGYLVGEVVRRVTGQTVGNFFRQEVAEPLNADFHIGLPADADGRVSNLVAPPPVDFSSFGADPNSLTIKTLGNPFLSVESVWTTAWRRAEIPAANGHGNARSVGLVQSLLACGGELNGRRILSERGCNALFEEQANGVDLVLALPITFGMGYGLRNSMSMINLGERSCFWCGYGGSMVVIDCDTRSVISYVMNRMEGGILGDARGYAFIAAAQAAIAGTD